LYVAAAAAAVAVAALACAGGAQPTFSPHITPLHSCAFPFPTPYQVAKLTRTQTSLIRMHRDLVDALAAVRRLPVVSVAAGKGGAAGGAGSGPAPAAPPHLDLGLGAGAACTASYKPNPAGGGFETTGVPPKREVAAASAAAPQVTAALRDRMAQLLNGQLQRLVELGSQFADAAGAAFAMWTEHIQVRARRRAARRAGGGAAHVIIIIIFCLLV
jgi:hypothetical protein